MKKTKIIATVGPSCAKNETLKALIRAGVDLFRINASHTDPAGLKEWVLRVRKAGAQLGIPVSILVDLQGPRVRTGRLKEGKPLNLKKGSPVTIIASSSPGFEGRITTSCREFSKMVKAGDSILLDNGLMELEVQKVKGHEVLCRVIRGGTLGENKGINLPHAPVTLPALGPKDLRDLQAATRMGVDYIALSFVRSAEDVRVAKRWLQKHGKNIPVIAKIEKPKAVTSFSSILDVADGIMVARGDLGIEMGVEKVPVIQKLLIAEANRRNLPVITATQMLESMIDQPTPTRAEASDVANAVFDGTDAVMLSGETAIGQYPLEVIRVMSQIILDAEKHIGEIPAETSGKGIRPEDRAISSITHAARHAAKDLGAKAIIVFTLTGKTAVLLCKFRPVAMIIALTPSDAISRRLNLFRGVFPLRIRYGKTPYGMIQAADKVVTKAGFLVPGNPVVLLSGKYALPGTRYMTKVHVIGDKEWKRPSRHS